MNAHRPWVGPLLAAIVGLLLATPLTGIDVLPGAWSRVDRAAGEVKREPRFGPGRAIPPGWKAVVDGLSPIDSPATLRFDVAADGDRPTALWLVLGQPQGMRVQVRHSRDGGQTWRQIWRGGAPEPGRLVDLGPTASGQVEIVAERAGWHSGRPDMVIRAVDVLHGVPRLPDLPGWLLTPVLAALIALLAGQLMGRGAPWLPALIGVGGAAAAVGVLMLAVPRLSGMGVWVAAGCAVLALRGGGGASVVLAATYAALAWRWNMMLPQLQHALERDVIGFVDIAAPMTHPSATSFREPLFAWMIAGMRQLVGEIAAPRLLSVIGGVALVPAIAWLGSRLEMPRVGTVAAVLWCSSSWLALQSIRGYRFDWYLLLGIVFLGLVLTREPRDLLAGFTGALLLLLRMSATAPVLVGLGWLWWRGGKGYQRALVLLAPVVLTVTPHLWHNATLAESGGDPMYSVNIHAKYYRNYEFAGTGSHLSVQELEPDKIYSGEPISVAGYLFGYHTIPQLVEFEAQGVWQIMAGGIARNQYYRDGAARQLLCLAGLLLWLTYRRRWGLLLALLLIWGPAPAILIATVKLDPRLVYTVAPLLELASAEALVTLAGAVVGHDLVEPAADVGEAVGGEPVVGGEVLGDA